ncbi:MAG: DUF4358 domain-containing protein [Ruminococcaceae bacterium]|nr:DUF4358 domain-containing protein [Oscillospiraceae bacterium]
MKKYISIFLAVVLTFTLFTACGRNKDKNNSSSMNSNSTSSGMNSNSDSNSDSGMSGSSGSGSNSSESGTESFPDSSGSGMPASPDEGDLSSGDPGSSLRPSEAQNRNLDEIAAALKEEYGNDYLPDTVISNSEIEEMTGITSDMYEDIYGEKSAMSMHPDIFIAVKAKNNKKDEVKKLLEKYKETMASDKNYEAAGERINNAQVMEQDNYVFLYLLGKSDFGDTVSDIGGEIGKELKRAEEVIKNMLS